MNLFDMLVNDPIVLSSFIGLAIVIGVYPFHLKVQSSVGI